MSLWTNYILPYGNWSMNPFWINAISVQRFDFLDMSRKKESHFNLKKQISKWWDIASRFSPVTLSLSGFAFPYFRKSKRWVCWSFSLFELKFTSFDSFNFSLRDRLFISSLDTLLRDLISCCKLHLWEGIMEIDNHFVNIGIDVFRSYPSQHYWIKSP